MSILRRQLRAALFAPLLAACAPAGDPPLPADGAPARHTVYYISNGWHTGLVVARRDLPAGRIPEAAHFPGAAWLELGWGDRDYYPAPRPTLGMTLAAALTPTPAVVHLAGRDRPPAASGRGTEVLAVPVTDAGLARLAARLHAAFDRPEGGLAATVAPGLYPDSRFYAARGEFHLFNTCNTWTARMLAAAGLPISTGVITADELTMRLRALLAEADAHQGVPSGEAVGP